MKQASMAKKPVVLIIRDGWGINPGGKAQAVANGDATLLAKTPFHDHLYATYPRGTVSASGEDVGLPDGWVWVAADDAFMSRDHRPVVVEPRATYGCRAVLARPDRYIAAVER
jgi:hypothetical protein